MREDILHYRATIQKYRNRFSSLNKMEASELDHAYEEIRRIQSRCYHQFSRIALFRSESWVCDFCGFEDVCRREQHGAG